MQSLWLQYLQTNQVTNKVTPQELSWDSNNMAGRATGKSVAEHIIDMLEKHEMNINSCQWQVYSNASAMSSDIKGA